ncbi:hypothetical protein A0H81_14613 [Grifola frondosa]|uniref:Uncharacterized protein n=1 Tax=Grifola frondosa TaxID=5627 RepID=A0A1C7LLI0_GRIFR|nr:hypothetical protein A0H81_14613 [Grifola frondosa]
MPIAFTAAVPSSVKRIAQHCEMVVVEKKILCDITVSQVEDVASGVVNMLKISLILDIDNDISDESSGYDPGSQDSSVSGGRTVSLSSRHSSISQDSLIYPSSKCDAHNPYEYRQQALTEDQVGFPYSREGPCKDISFPPPLSRESSISYDSSLPPHMQSPMIQTHKSYNHHVSAERRYVHFGDSDADSSSDRPSLLMNHQSRGHRPPPLEHRVIVLEVENSMLRGFVRDLVAVVPRALTSSIPIPSALLPTPPTTASSSPISILQPTSSLGFGPLPSSEPYPSATSTTTGLVIRSPLPTLDRRTYPNVKYWKQCEKPKDEDNDAMFDNSDGSNTKGGRGKRLSYNKHF